MDGYNIFLNNSYGGQIGPDTSSMRNNTTELKMDSRWQLRRTDPARLTG